MCLLVLVRMFVCVCLCVCLYVCVCVHFIEILFPSLLSDNGTPLSSFLPLSSKVSMDEGAQLLGEDQTMTGEG